MLGSQKAVVKAVTQNWLKIFYKRYKQCRDRQGRLGSSVLNNQPTQMYFPIHYFLSNLTNHVIIITRPKITKYFYA